MGNIHTVGPNEALVVSGSSYNIDLTYKFYITQYRMRV